MTCSALRKCEFSCTGGNCKPVVCRADTCEQGCAGGRCGLECHGNSCRQICPGGGCDLVFYGNSCEQSCSNGGCGMKCQGKRCKQSCVRGNCELQCPNPNDQRKCEQRCIANRGTCTIKELPFSPPPKVPVIPKECENVVDGVCQQSCVGGRCTMECFKSEHYHSCKQICTGNSNTNINLKSLPRVLCT